MSYVTDRQLAPHHQPYRVRLPGYNMMEIFVLKWINYSIAFLYMINNTIVAIA